MAELDKELEKIEAGNAWAEKDEVVEVEVKKPLDKVVPVRLSSDVWARLRKEARELGVGPTTLARMWILERLRSIPVGKESGVDYSNRKGNFGAIKVSEKKEEK